MLIATELMSDLYCKDYVVAQGAATVGLRVSSGNQKLDGPPASHPSWMVPSCGPGQPSFHPSSRPQLGCVEMNQLTPVFPLDQESLPGRDPALLLLAFPGPGTGPETRTHGTFVD